MQSANLPEQATSFLPKAIGFGIISFYSLFTLLPNSNSLMVKWPWVFLWQFGLMLGPIMLISQLWRQSFLRLGTRLDGLAISWILLLVTSSAFAPFPHQAFWYSWAVICSIAFLYVLNIWLTSTRRVRTVLIFQGSLSTIFSGLSLVSWLLQTVRPYFHTLEELKSYGIERSFDLKIETLRNWYPLGHQNYVAGYLLLALPLLVGLAFSHNGWQRLVWLSGFSLGLVALCSTASRAGWIGFVGSTAVFIGLSVWQYPQLRKALLGVTLAISSAIALWGFSSDRVRGLFSALFNQGEGGEFSYRAITNATGWAMGLDHPILGSGVGSVTLLYQKYRPSWAGREAELTYQLHSTPAQLWAELGFVGSLLTLASLAAIVCLIFRWGIFQRRTSIFAITNTVAVAPAIIGVISGLAGYSIYAITDYQLDNICISGTIIIFVAVLIFENRHLSQSGEMLSASEIIISQPVLKRTALAGTSLLVAISIWLYPIHRAWMLSSQGFLALHRKDIASFVTHLEKAHMLAPWEPYYAYQLGWNLGELAFQSDDIQQQEALRLESVYWFEKAIALSPNNEFGYANLGWLLVNSEPDKATAAFLKSTQLVPAKRGAYFALGYSLLKQGEPEIAIQAMSIALMQQPVLLTSPIWKSNELSDLYPNVIAAFEASLRMLQETSDSEKSLHQLIGMIHWWKGEYALAREPFSHIDSELNTILLKIADTRSGEEVVPKLSASLETNVVIAAWDDPMASESLLLKALLLNNPTYTKLDTTYLRSLVSEIQKSISKSASFYDLLTRSGPSRQRRNQRLGYGTISRHIDGPLPKDFSSTLENVLMTDFLSSLLPEPINQSHWKALKKQLDVSLETHLSNL